MIFLMQFYQAIPYQEINEQYLWEQRLEPLLSYLSEDHCTKVREALSLGYDAHIQQKRKSGEPFITHPVEVTRILAELQMDHESLIAGKLPHHLLDCVSPHQPSPIRSPLSERYQKWASMIFTLFGIKALWLLCRLTLHT